MTTTSNGQLLEEEIKNSADLMNLRQKIRSIAGEIGFGLVKQTKLVTASSELMRNIINFASQGTVKVIEETEHDKTGIKIVFSDSGPGMENIEKCMQKGYKGPDSKGQGQGLSGTKRLVDKFDIESEPGVGTTVTILMWE